VKLRHLKRVLHAALAVTLIVAAVAPAVTLIVAAAAAAVASAMISQFTVTNTAAAVVVAGFVNPACVSGGSAGRREGARRRECEVFDGAASSGDVRVCRIHRVV
jgi:hypothetical protein